MVAPAAAGPCGSRQARGLHATPRREALPLLALGKGVTGLAARFGMRYAGRTARKKYGKMSEKEKEEFRKKWGLTALSTVSFCAVGTMVYYRMHLETLEISRRTRFICTSPEYENKIGIETCAPGRGFAAESAGMPPQNPRTPAAHCVPQRVEKREAPPRAIPRYENLILEDESEKALPMSDPRYKRVKRVLRQLTEAIHDSNDLPIEA